MLLEGDIPLFVRIHVCVYICLSPRPNENLVHTCVTPVNYIIDFFENVTLGVVSLKKLLVHLDFCISPLLFCQKVREALGDIHIFPHISVYLYIYLFVSRLTKRKTIQT